MRVLRILLVAAFAACWWPAPAAADLSVGTDARIRIDVGVRSLGEYPPGVGTLAAAGDVNGDGMPDVLIGDPRVCAVHVVFGKPGLAIVQAGAPGTGFSIRGRGTECVGTTVAAAGDVNGDGLSDFVTTASYRAYVVFGSRSTATVRAASIGSRGIAITGISGGAAAGAGDVNGDGRPDVVMGLDAYGTRPRAAVIFGGPAGRVDAARPGARGFVISASSGDLGLGTALAGAGDVNGDGRADVVLGVPEALGRDRREEDLDRSGPGAAWLLLGDPSHDPVDLRTSPRALRIDPPADASRTGAAVGPAGDVNGDGLADFAVGVPAKPGGGGSAYILYGSRTPAAADLDTLGDRGFRLDSSIVGEGFGHAFGGNLLIGAPGFELREGLPEEAGAAYLLRGTQIVETIRGLPESRAGAAVAAPGDLDGDGQEDLLLLAPRSCGGAHRSRGQTVRRQIVRVIGVTPGLPGRIPTTSSRCLRGTTAKDSLTGTRSGDLVQGLEGDDALRGGSGTDLVLGGAGADRLDGGPGKDTLDGGFGADRLEARDGTRDDVRCGPGRDSARVDRRDLVVGCERVRR